MTRVNFLSSSLALLGMGTYRYQVYIDHRDYKRILSLSPEPTARSAVPGVSPGPGLLILAEFKVVARDLLVIMLVIV